MKNELGNVILITRDCKNKKLFEIVENNNKYSLLFLEWNYAEKPWDYVDPIIVDKSFKTCLKKLCEILSKIGEAK